MTMALIDNTGFPYVRDEYPDREHKGSLSEYVNIGTYTPPRDWGEMNKHHRAWMAPMPPLVHKLVRDSTTKPLNIMTQMICVKNWAREQGILSEAGVVVWVNFSSIEPQYVALDQQESYRLISKDEYDEETA